jgi:hypothetical protein
MSILFFGHSTVLADNTPTPFTPVPAFPTPTLVPTINDICPTGQPINWGTGTPDPIWLYHCKQCLTLTPDWGPTWTLAPWQTPGTEVPTGTIQPTIQLSETPTPSMGQITWAYWNDGWNDLEPAVNHYFSNLGTYNEIKANSVTAGDVNAEYELELEGTYDFNLRDSWYPDYPTIDLQGCNKSNDILFFNSVELFPGQCTHIDTVSFPPQSSGQQAFSGSYDFMVTGYQWGGNNILMEFVISTGGWGNWNISNNSYVYVSDSFSNPTPTPSNPTATPGYCSVVPPEPVVPPGTCTDIICMPVPWIIGPDTCAGIPDVVFDPTNFLMNVFHISEPLHGFNIAGWEVCLRPVEIDNMWLFGIEISFNAMLLVMSMAFVIRRWGGV